MLRSLYRTLFTYAIFRNYFSTIFTIMFGIIAITEISFFYSDIFELTQREEPSLFVQGFFALKWLLIFGFTLYFFYALYNFKPNKEKKKPKKTVKEKTVNHELKDQHISAKTQDKLNRLLHKKTLESHRDKILK
ncbi:MAG: hypothetical protein U9P71_08330 [Campylobacterota bacterium]|nr:hypothetical protein [Campylobacterota bacterium]